MRDSKSAKIPHTQMIIIYDETKLLTFRSELINIDKVLLRPTECVENHVPVDSIVNSVIDSLYAATASVR